MLYMYLEYYLSTSTVSAIIRYGLICGAIFQFLCIVASIVLPAIQDPIEEEEEEPEDSKSSSESSSPCAGAFSCIKRLAKLKKLDRKKRK